MIKSQFEEEWQSLKESHVHGSFSYNDSSLSIRTVINSHFRRVQCKEKYGVYVIRQEATMDVLYIGKGGTVKQDGEFKAQDIPRRLKNRKGGDMTAEEWFWELFDEKGPLLIEYIFTKATPKSPALLETTLIQAFLNEFGRLPYRNKVF